MRRLALLSRPRNNGPGQVRFSGARQAREQQGVARQAVAHRVVHPVPPPRRGRACHALRALHAPARTRTVLPLSFTGGQRTCCFRRIRALEAVLLSAIPVKRTAAASTHVLSRVFLLQSHLSKFARGTWTRNLDNVLRPDSKPRCQGPTRLILVRPTRLILVRPTRLILVCPRLILVRPTRLTLVRPTCLILDPLGEPVLKKKTTPPPDLSGTKPNPPPAWADQLDSPASTPQPPASYLDESKPASSTSSAAPSASLLGKPGRVRFFFKYWFAQRVWGFWLSTGLPNGSGRGLFLFF